MKNSEIAKILFEVGEYYETKRVPFKPRAYEKAAAAIEELDTQLRDIYQAQGRKGLLEIGGVGPGIADHIVELLKTGKLKKYQLFKNQLPVNLAELTAVPGLGPRTARALYEKLGIRNLKDLKKALVSEKIRKLPGFGEKSEEQLLHGLAFVAKQTGRFALGQIWPVANELSRQFEKSKLFAKFEIAGSYRRRQETVGDLDIVATAPNQEKAMKFFVGLPGTEKLEQGPTKSVIRLRQNGAQVDLRIVPPESYGAAQQYFTGDIAHNIHLRKIAIKKGLKLSEYGLFPTQKSKIKNQNYKSKIKTETEKDVYHALDMDWIPPELRTDTGEIEAALRQAQGKPGGLPKLIDYGDVVGDLQVQTNWTDGAHSIEEMAREAKRLGRQYLAITDHTKYLAFTGGNDERRLLKQMKEIDRVQKKIPGIKILKGAEVNILQDGSLDIEDKVLAQLEVVGVSLHSHFKMTSEDMTRRICRAFANPHVDIFFHPTTRIINRRPPVEFDFEAVLKTAKKHGIALEINAHPGRLDIHDTLIRRCVEEGVKMTIDSDAHLLHELDYLHFGIAQARRGWAARSDILNTLPVDKLLKVFKK